ncbi:MFS transporter [Nonomuraea sp. WAC 01424]|uniref:MFS transporter n=1 Tax=Nonomuraea sp. WAC 01424 TaxID=2203200 RepID=UPI000F776901|nr:MFS transporter [Nonomuraea sp. WAC 01424]RSM94874.1 MFS transporter [Nonomuraea sp. WAC 01424]
MRARLPLRLARTAAFSAVCVTLAALAHVVGGGGRPEPLAAALGLVAVSGLGLALSGRERSAATINIVLGAAQFGLHELFAGGSASSYVFEHGHGQGLAVNAGMLLAHLVATLMTGWWLSRGEVALWSLLRRLGLRLMPPLLGVVPAVRPGVPVVHTRVVPLAPGFRHRVARRGPPLPA